MRTVLDVAVAEFGEHAEPVPGALVSVTCPDPEDVAGALDGHGHGDMDRSVRNLAVVDLHVDGAHERDRVDAVQRP